LSISATARALGLHRHTIEKYDRLPAPPERRHTWRRPSALAPYEGYLQERRRQGARKGAAALARAHSPRLRRRLRERRPLPGGRAQGGSRRWERVAQCARLDRAASRRPGAGPSRAPHCGRDTRPRAGRRAGTGDRHTAPPAGAVRTAHSAPGVRSNRRAGELETRRRGDRLGGAGDLRGAPPSATGVGLLPYPFSGPFRKTPTARADRSCGVLVYRPAISEFANNIMMS
jgi:hypothetical protein